MKYICLIHLEITLAIALIKAGYSINSTVPSEIEAAKDELLEQRKCN